MMTTTEPAVNVKLLQDLRQKYPDVSDSVITSYVRQHRNNRQKCIEALDKETPNALFGTSGGEPYIQQRFQDMHIKPNEQRSRSDSASSGISSSSSTSSSYVHSDYRQPPMEPSFTSEFNQFVKEPRSSNIPNIECSVSSNQQGLRQIPIQHIQTIRSPAEKPSGNPTNPLVYNILYQQQTDVRQPHGGQQIGQPNFSNTHGNINYALSRKPITSHSNANPGPPVAQRSFSVQPGIDHHAQMSVNIVRLPPGDRTPVYSPGNYNATGLHPSQSDSFLQLIGNGASHGGNNYNYPLFINVGTPPNYTNENLTSQSTGDLSRTDYNIHGAINPPSFTYLPDHSVSGGTSHGDNGHYYPRVPPIASRSSSSESDHSVIGNHDRERHVTTLTFTPKAVPSPSSSHSSLSSDSSHNHPPEIPQRQSGNVQEEAAYTQALITFQRERMLKLKLDLETELRKLAKLRSQVNQMEKNMLENRRARSVSCLQVEDIAKLREKNRQLQTDIQVMTREIEQYNNGLIPLGVCDPNSMEQQNFFQNMNPGQRGSIFAPPPREPPTSNSPPPPIPPRMHATPPAPPQQPPVNSGDSDGDGEQWSCVACTFLNHPALNKCECCEMPRMNSSPPSTGISPHGT